jgi:glycosyltransferase involved in cell wall biosynthesis
MTLRVALLSANPTTANPYIGLLQSGLEAAGAQVTLCNEPGSDGLPEAARSAHLVHLHWLELWGRPAYRSLAGLSRWGKPGRGLRRLLEPSLNSPARFANRRRRFLDRFLAALADYKATGGRVVYTVHNLGQHEGEADEVETDGLRRLLALADAVHVHGPSLAAAVQALLPPRSEGFWADEQSGSSGIKPAVVTSQTPPGLRVVIIPHGHYIDAYPNRISRSDARIRLGLPADAFVFLSLGLIRPYKGLEALIAAFRSLPAVEARLLLAGQPRPREYAASLEPLARSDLRIVRHPLFVPDAEVQVWMNAADVVVLPYRHVTTSGAALLAFSFGKPIIAPALPGFLELMHDNPELGLLYDPVAFHGLADALRQAQTTDWQAHHAQILSWVKQLDWAGIGRQFVDLYEEVVNGYR